MDSMTGRSRFFYVLCMLSFLLSPGPVPTAVCLDSTGSVTCCIEPGEYRITESEGMHEIHLAGFGVIGEPGKPRLPGKIFAVAIPPGAEPFAVRVDGGAQVILEGTYRIGPTQLTRPLSREDPAVQTRREAVWQTAYDEAYGCDEQYPSEPGWLVRRAGFRKYNLVDVRVAPFRYCPRSGLVLFHPCITITVDYHFPQTGGQPVPCDHVPEMEEAAREIIFNYREAQAWYEASSCSPQAPSHDFVIITLESLVSEVTPLVNHEMLKSRSPEVVTVEWISANYSGVDLPARIRTFLREKYPSSAWGIRDVLLVGDHQDLPFRECWVDAGYGRPFSDFYYAELSEADEDSWDADGDQRYGEDYQDNVDLYSEVNIGRIPWSDGTTVRHICEKSVAFELNSDPSFKKNIMVLGGFCWADTDTAWLMEAKLNQPWMADWSVTRMYEDNADNLSSFPMDYALNKDSVVAAWSSGRYSMVSMAGSSSNAFIESGEVNRLNDEYPAIVWADACLISDPTTSNLGRQLMRRGAVGYLGSTQVADGQPGWRGPEDGSSQSLDYWFTARVTSGEMSQGEAHQWALRKLYQDGLWAWPSYEMFGWTLYGNPDLGLGTLSDSGPIAAGPGPADNNPPLARIFPPDQNADGPAQLVQPDDAAQEKYHPLQSNRVFLVPVCKEESWQEFAFLSAIPASNKLNGDAPSVIAVDGFGVITEEVEDYLERLAPLQTTLIGREAEWSVCHWQLDEGAGVMAVDSSGNGHDGNIEGATWVGNSLEFDGNNDYVDIVGYQGITGVHGRTVAAWIKTTDKNCEILSWGRSTSPGGCWSMGLDDQGMLRLFVGNAYITGETGLNDGNWHHVAVSLDDHVSPYIENVQLFVDGSLEEIGEVWDGASSSTLTNNLIGYWQMNEGSGTVILDSSSGGSMGAFHTDFSSGGDYPDWGTGLLGMGLYFDNLDYIEIDNESHFDGTASAFTVSCWVKHNWIWGQGGNDEFVTKGNQYFDGWTLGRAYDSDWGKASANAQDVESPALANPGMWIHVVSRFDGNTLSIHVNGNEEDTKAIGPLSPTNTPVYIGCGADSGGNPSGSGPTYGRYKGWIDEVAIWDRDLTENEIDTLYNNGAGMVIETAATPIETVAADTVKIGAFNTNQSFFKGMIEDVRIYHRALTGEEVHNLEERRHQDFTGITLLPATALDETVCSMADTFWQDAEYVVLCEENDYHRALCASVLASRLQAPLLYFDEGQGLSNKTQATVGGLTPTLALLVGQNTYVVEQLTGMGISTTTLLDAREVLAWMTSNQMEVDYLALVNPNDRVMGRVTKSSLAGALLAAGRNGALVPLAYDTDWKHPFWYDGIAVQPPAGAPGSLTGLWYTGTLSLGVETYDFVISALHDPIHYSHLNIDFNGNGNFGDPGDGPYESADVVEIEGTRYALSVGVTESITPGNIKFTYPCADEIKEDLAPFHSTLGHFPEYLCVIGLPEAIPFGLVNGCYAYADSEDLPTDAVFGNVDNDLFIEIAVGRVFGENLCSATLLASRSLTYDALIDNPDTWAKRCMWVGEFWDQLHVMPRKLENVGFYPAVIHSHDPGYDKSLLNVVIQDDHGGPGGIGGGWNTDLETLLAPCIVEAGGCDSAGIDETTLDQTLSGQLLKKGAIAYGGTQRGTPEDKRVYRQVMWNAVLEGATLGQAHRRGLNAMWVGYLDEVQPPVYMHYCLYSEAFYGDPALKIYIPSDPVLAPAQTEIQGTTYSAVAPEAFWIDTINEGPYAGFYHNGPGMHPDYDQSIQFFFAEWKTDQPVWSMTQDPSVPSPLGWTGHWFMDEHQDGTFSIYTRVRFTDFDNNTGQITNDVDRVDFTVDF